MNIRAKNALRRLNRESSTNNAIKVATQSEINDIDAEIQEIKNLISNNNLAQFRSDQIDKYKVAKLIIKLEKSGEKTKKKYTQKRVDKFHKISDELMENILTLKVAKDFEKSNKDSINTDINRTVLETKEYIESCQLDQLDKQLQEKADNLMSKFERAAETFKKHPNQYNLNKFDHIGSLISNEILDVANKAWEVKDAAASASAKPVPKSKPLPKTPPEIAKEKAEAKVQMQYVMNEILASEQSFRVTVQRLVHFVNTVIETNPTGSTPEQLEQLKQFIKPYQEIAANGKGLVLTNTVHQDLPLVIDFIKLQGTWAGMLEVSKNYDAFNRLMVDINQHQEDKHQPTLSELYSSYEKFNWEANPRDHLILPVQRSTRYSLLLDALSKEATKAGLSATEIKPLVEIIDDVKQRTTHINQQTNVIIHQAEDAPIKENGKDITQRMRGISRSMAKGVKNISGRLEEKANEKEAKKADFFSRLDRVMESAEGDKIHPYNFSKTAEIKRFTLDQQVTSGENQAHIEQKR